MAFPSTVLARAELNFESEPEPGWYRTGASDSARQDWAAPHDSTHGLGSRPFGSTHDDWRGAVLRAELPRCPPYFRNRKRSAGR